MNKTATLISDAHTLYYLTGFETLSPHEREAVGVLIGKNKYVITDARYVGQNSSTYTLIITKPGEGIFAAIQNLCYEQKISTLIYQSDNLTEFEASHLKKGSIETRGETRLFIQERSIKTQNEIGYVRHACEIGDKALFQLIPTIVEGQTEQEIAWRLEKIIREELHAEIAFDPIIAVDAHAAIPHYNTKKGSGVVTNTSTVLIDFGVKYKNYCSDITRMLVAKNVKNDVVSSYQDLYRAQTNTISKMNEWSYLRDVDIFCRNELMQLGHPSYPHSTGHGIGLEVHESPRVHAKSSDMKQDGQIFTVEPGIYYEGKWGMRLEDTVVVTPLGSVELLTHFPKELIHLR